MNLLLPAILTTAARKTLVADELSESLIFCFAMQTWDGNATTCKSIFLENDLSFIRFRTRACFDEQKTAY